VIRDLAYRFAPAVPPVTVHANGFDWHKYLYPAIACVIVAAVVIGVWRSLPKWLLVVMVFLLLVVAGLIKVSGALGGHA
jgi:hypothetical protein